MTGQSKFWSGRSRGVDSEWVVAPYASPMLFRHGRGRGAILKPRETGLDVTLPTLSLPTFRIIRDLLSYSRLPTLDDRSKVESGPHSPSRPDSGSECQETSTVRCINVGAFPPQTRSGWFGRRLHRYFFPLRSTGTDRSSMSSQQTRPHR